MTPNEGDTVHMWNARENWFGQTMKQDRWVMDGAHSLPIGTTRDSRAVPGLETNDTTGAWVSTIGERFATFPIVHVIATLIDYARCTRANVIAEECILIR